LPIRIDFIVEPLRKLQQFAVSESNRQGNPLKVYDDIVTICDDTAACVLIEHFQN
jgi:hypothetical protein